MSTTWHPSPTDSNCYRARARCPVHIEANTMALAFKKNNLYHKINQQEDKRQSSNLSSDLGFKERLTGFRETCWHAKSLEWGRRGGKFQLEGLGAWLVMVRYGKGFSTQPPWTVDPSLLKGFWCSGSSFVLVLWFRGVERLWSKSSPLHML